MSAEVAARHCLAGISKGKEDILIGKSSLARWLAVINFKRGMAITNR